MNSEPQSATKKTESGKRPFIGTISININAPDFNYGAILHSWAFQQYLLKSGLAEKTEIIDFKMPKVEGFNRKSPFAFYIKNGKAKSMLRIMRGYRTYLRRLKKFDLFIRNEMKVSEEKYITRTLNKAILPYDTVIVESDVVWDWRTGFGFDKGFFLGLDSMKKAKRIAYAPSMSDAKFSEQQLDLLKEKISGLDAISCRESYGAKLLEKLTGSPVKHVMDPVLLLESEEYDCITAPGLSKEPYLLLYLPVNNNEKLRESARLFAQKNHLVTIEISTKLKNRKLNNGFSLGDAGIEEFLSAIKNAEMVFTNSFHAVCFCLIFEKQFYAFTRKKQKKVIDICETFGLQERYMWDDTFTEREPIDYSVIREKRKRLKMESEKWLREAVMQE